MEREYLGRYTPSQTRFTPPGTMYTPWTRYSPPWNQVHPCGTRYTPVGPGTSPGTRYNPRTRYTPGTSACREIRATSGRYASYWNASNNAQCKRSLNIFTADKESKGNKKRAGRLKGAGRLNNSCVKSEMINRDERFELRVCQVELSTRFCLRF